MRTGRTRRGGVRLLSRLRTALAGDVGAEHRSEVCPEPETRPRIPRDPNNQCHVKTRHAMHRYLAGRR